MVHSDDPTLPMAPHSCPAVASAAPSSDARAAKPPPKQPREKKGGRNNANSGPPTSAQQGTPRKSNTQRHLRDSNRGRQPSAQRTPKSDSDEAPPTPTKKAPRRRQQPQQQQVTLLTRDASDGEQQALLARLKGTGSATPARRARSPDEGQTATPPPASSRRARPAPGPSTVFSPTPRKGYAEPVPAGYPRAVQACSPRAMQGGSPRAMQGGSPKAAHYAGASFNNSPAANTLPLPPSFLTTPTKSPLAGRAGIACDEDVFGLSPVRMTLGERERQLESIVGPYRVPQPQFERAAGLHHMPQSLPPPPQFGYHGSHSVADLSQPDAGVASIFQKLRLAMDLSQKRPATVAPVSGAGPRGPHHFAPVYNA